MLRLKKIVVFVILVSIFMFTSVNALAHVSNENQDKPSHWAEQEVDDAIEKGLVPEELQSNYQSNIKRYQYVLLALRVFGKTGKTVDIADAQPFTDS
ncbi:MAG: S-layer homology domain-containing protein, partial [Clostridiaceae bacterium]|nr:S-layer homology domain-containing protein [Clostridiaceae bacterium]